MRICILSNFRNAPDEGMKIVAVCLARELSKSHEVIHVNARLSVFSWAFWRNLRSLQPEIVHIFLGPFLNTFIIGKAIKLCASRAKLVISVLQPPPSRFLLKAFAPTLRPDLVLAQSESTKRFFANLGYMVAILGSGVDVTKFAPVPKDMKIGLREKYSLDTQAFVILHVGHLIKGRNLDILGKLASQMDKQVIIVAGTTFKKDKKIFKSLEGQGCIIWTDYFENIEEVYNLSDCYVFPTEDSLHSIEIPLSVMEAMSCNLPVVSTRFGALPEMFKEGEGLTFVESEKDFAPSLTELYQGEVVVNTRAKVLPHTWDNIAAQLEKLYTAVVAEVI